jgi:polysaccharide deacetylase family protein (PEP-CTERM system associated)
LLPELPALHANGDESTASCLQVDPPLNAFTVDVEDYFQVSGFERDVQRRDWTTFVSRVTANTQLLLELLSRANVRGTFFVLGWVAERFPELVRSINAAGHEIGSHGYWHHLVYDQSPDDFRADLILSQEALQGAIGRGARLFRAPSFSVIERSTWALEILAEEGFNVDASIFPIRHDRYGIPCATPFPHVIETAAGPIAEFPGSVARLAGLNVPIAGGGYFRLAPYRLAERLLNRINCRDLRPFVFYVHPWEVDPEQPRMSAGSPISRWRHYVNLRSTMTKLERLLRRYRFGTLSESLLAWADRENSWPASVVDGLRSNVASFSGYPISRGIVDAR